jgi:DNA-binding transcriptional MerR regulator
VKIGDLAGRVGVETSTIRYYESVGLLPEPSRTPSGYRDYDDGDIDRLSFIRSARDLGLGLDAIGDIIDFRDRGQTPCGHVVGLLADERRAIDHRIAELVETLRGIKVPASGVKSCLIYRPPKPVQALCCLSPESDLPDC